MIEDVFVGAPVGLMEGRVDVEIMIARIKRRPSQIVKKIVVRFVARGTIFGFDDRSRRAPAREIGQEIHRHVRDVPEARDRERG